MESPRPSPSAWPVRSAPSRWKGRSSRSTAAAGTAGPVFLPHRTPRGARLPVTDPTGPPGPLGRTALSARLAIRGSAEPRSPVTEARERVVGPARREARVQVGGGRARGGRGGGPQGRGGPRREAPAERGGRRRHDGERDPGVGEELVQLVCVLPGPEGLHLAEQGVRLLGGEDPGAGPGPGAPIELLAARRPAARPAAVRPSHGDGKTDIAVRPAI